MTVESKWMRHTKFDTPFGTEGKERDGILTKLLRLAWTERIGTGQGHEHRASSNGVLGVAFTGKKENLISFCRR